MKYVIEKGKHYNNSKIRLLLSVALGLINGELIKRTFMLNFSKTMARYVRFDADDWYPRSSIKHTGWNKLYGFSGWNIHKYSGRLVWQPDFGQVGSIRIGLYVYGFGDGKWKFKHIATIGTEEEHITAISAKGTYYEGYVGQFHETLGAEKTPHFIKAEPYFGGKSTAPKKITIHLWNKWFYELFK